MSFDPVLKPVDYNREIMQLSLRAEKQAEEILANTFVSLGLLDSLFKSKDNQIIIGRRGTGKTHIVKYQAGLRRKDGDISIYIDMQNIGSSGGLYHDPNYTIEHRGTRIVADFFQAFSESLLSELVGNDDISLGSIENSLDEIAKSVTTIEVVGDIEASQSDSFTGMKRGDLKTDISLSSNKGLELTLAGGNEHSDTTTSSNAIKVSGKRKYSIKFGPINRLLNSLCEKISGKRIWIFIDEWSTIPIDLQPIVADFIRRSLMPVQGITIKIATIEYRSNFYQRNLGVDYMGIEVGGDAATSVNLDDYLVFEYDNARAIDYFKSLLYNHLKFGSDIGRNEYFPTTHNSLISGVFTQVDAFAEFVASAEGVPRDGINILAKAAQYAGEQKISIPYIRRAARDWYQQGKSRNLKGAKDAEKMLGYIMGEVIDKKQARAFLLQANVEDKTINELYDYRLIHVIRKNISAHDRPGIRYNAYKMDYGCYIDLVSTAKETRGLFQNDESSSYVNIPPDDYRSIRRAILELDSFYNPNPPLIT
jgi:hypothetical protein